LTLASASRRGSSASTVKGPTQIYFTIDGASANVGVSTSAIIGEQVGGSVPALGITGGTNNLVSVDATQEFRIQTSTYAPEFGRQPGGQVSIQTRAGTNQFHGTAFDYVRNDVFDAADWFVNRSGLKPPSARMTRWSPSGPIIKNRIFFFFLRVCGCVNPSLRLKSYCDKLGKPETKSFRGSRGNAAAFECLGPSQRFDLGNGQAQSNEVILIQRLRCNQR
jgi:hypothetical protein